MPRRIFIGTAGWSIPRAAAATFRTTARICTATRACCGAPRSTPPSIARTPRPRMPDGRRQHRPDSASPSRSPAPSRTRGAAREPAAARALPGGVRGPGQRARTVNSELSVLRQALKHAKWYRFGEDYKALKNTKPPAGQAPHRRRSGAALFICEVQSGLVLRLRGGDAGLLLRPARV